MTQFIKSITVNNGSLQDAIAAPVDSESMTATGVNPGSYGDATHTSVIAVDASGRVIQLVTIPIAFPPPTTPAGSSGQVQFNQGGGFAGTAGIVYNPSGSPNVLMQAQAPGDVVAVDQGAAGQTANLREWRDPNDTLLTAITSDGRLRLFLNNNRSVWIDLFTSTDSTNFYLQFAGGGGATNPGIVGYAFGSPVFGTTHAKLQPDIVGGTLLLSEGSSWSSNAGNAGCIIDTYSTITAAGAKMVSVRNGGKGNFNSGTEIFYVSVDGIVKAACLAGAISTVTAAYTLVATDKTILANATTGAFAVTLPAASSVVSGRPYTVKKIDSSANAVTLTASGADKIDGAAIYALGVQYQYAAVESDGVSNWWIVGNN